jgi:fucose permease
VLAAKTFLFLIHCFRGAIFPTISNDSNVDLDLDVDDNDGVVVTVVVVGGGGVDDDDDVTKQRAVLAFVDDNTTL